MYGCWLLTLASPMPSIARAWPPDPAVNVAVATTFERETDPRAVPDGSGGAIVFWRVHVLSPPPTGYYRYYLRVARLDATGTLMWPQSTTLGQTALLGPTVGGVTAAGGGWIVAWTGLSEPEYDVRVARLDAGGSLSWSDALSTPGVQVEPASTTDGQGGALVVWQDSRAGAHDLYAQRFDGAGARQWPTTGAPVCTASGAQTSAGIVPDGAGGAIVAWVDTRTATSQVFAQRLAPDGSRLWPADGVALAPAGGNQTALVMTGDGAGGAIVAWQDDRNGGDPDIYAQRLDGAGNLQWAAAGTQVAAAPGAVGPALAPDGAGGVIVAWSDTRSGAGDAGVFAQRLTAAGALAWPAGGLAVSVAPGPQIAPALAADGLGGAVVAWEDGRNGASDIYAQRLDATGAALWTPQGRPVSSASAAQRKATLAADGTGGVVVSWEDERAGLADIYAQRVDASGGLPVALQHFSIE